MEYRVSVDVMPYAEAKTWCAAWPGQMVSILSEAENSYVSAFCPPGECCFLGLNSIGIQLVFKWYATGSL